MSGRALVADPSLTVRMDLEEILEGAGLRSRLCSSEREAVGALAEEPFLLVLVDDSLADPVMGEIRRRRSTGLSSPRVVVLSNDREALADEVGTDVVSLPKPYDRDQLTVLARRLSTEFDDRGGTARPRVVAVDDSPTYLGRLEEEISKEDVEVILAGSGEEAIASLRERPADCVLLDLTMPGLSGEETCRRIRADEELREVPIIMLTADESRASMLEGLSAGADDFIAKSDDFEVVRARLRVQLRRRRLEEEARAARERILRLEEQRRTARMVEEQEERLRLVIEAAALGGWEWDRVSDTLTWTRTAHRLFGLPQGALEEDPDAFLERVHPDDRERARVLVRAESGGPTLEEELRVVGRGGRLRWLTARGRVMRRDGRARVFGVLTDVTDRRLREEESHRLAEFQQQLLGIVGHDLRNPLSAITTSAELIRMVASDERQRKAAKAITASASRATRLIGDLLDYTQARLGGGIPVELQEADVAATAESAVEELRAAWPDRTIRFEAERPTTARLDPDRLAQVVSNLVSNALTYSGEGSPVEVSVVTAPEEVWIEVRNDGEPIPPDVLPTLFQPFRRGERNGESGAGGNLGLGLYIVQQIVEAHEGRIDVSSSEEEGTTFAVCLPVAPSDGEEER